MMTTALKTQDSYDRALLEMSVIEEALPAHMMYLMAQSVVAGGYRLRPDIVHRLNVGAAAPLAGLGNDSHAIQRCAVEIDRIAQRVLYVLSPDEYVHGFYACAMFCLLLVDENFLADPQNLGVLVSMVCVDDLKQFDHVEGYKYNEWILRAEAKKMLTAARKEGVYKIAVAQKKVIGDGPGSSQPTLN
jgi:hypothetical protein